MKPSEAFLAWLDREPVQTKSQDPKSADWFDVRRFAFSSFGFSVEYNGDLACVSGDAMGRDYRLKPSGIAQTDGVSSASVKTAPCPLCACVLAVSSRRDLCCPECGHLDPSASAPSLEEKLTAMTTALGVVRDERFAMRYENRLLREVIVGTRASIRKNVELGSNFEHMEQFNEGALWALGVLSERENELLGGEVAP